MTNTRTGQHLGFSVDPETSVHYMRMATGAAQGRPLMEVLKTADELAADEAERQAEPPPADRPMAIMRTDEGRLVEVWSTKAQVSPVEAARQAVAAPAAAPAPVEEPPPAPVNRRAELAAMLTAVADAAPEINALTGIETVVLLASIRPLVAALANDGSPAPALPAELAAAGWRLCTMRGKHYATVDVAGEQEPIKTMLRLDLAATIRDAEYMHRNLKIGVTA